MGVAVFQQLSLVKSEIWISYNFPVIKYYPSCDFFEPFKDERPFLAYILRMSVLRYMGFYSRPFWN